MLKFNEVMDILKEQRDQEVMETRVRNALDIVLNLLVMIKRHPEVANYLLEAESMR